MTEDMRNGAQPAPDADFAFTPTSTLGRELWAIRKRAVAAGMKLLTDEDLDREIAERRGGVAVERDDADIR